MMYGNEKKVLLYSIQKANFNNKNIKKYIFYSVNS